MALQYIFPLHNNYQIDCNLPQESTYLVVTIPIGNTFTIGSAQVPSLQEFREQCWQVDYDYFSLTTSTSNTQSPTEGRLNKVLQFMLLTCIYMHCHGRPCIVLLLSAALFLLRSM